MACYGLGGHCDAVDSNANVATVNIFRKRVEIWDKYGHKAMKEHQIREMVNELRDVATAWHGTKQLRERIAHVVRKYLEEPQAEEQDDMCPRCGATVVNPYKQREWVGLTDEEILVDAGSVVCSYAGIVKFARAIEAKLKEKNAYGWQSVANPTEYLDDLRGGADE